MSERSDLWVPAVLVLAGLGLLVWHLLGADGHAVLGVLALLVGAGGALACLPLRVRHGQARVLGFGAGVALLLAALVPAATRSLMGTLPWLIGALAFLLPLRAVPLQTRKVMLAGAGLFALLALLCAVGVLPRGGTWAFVASAVFLAVQVWHSRPRPEKPPPPGQRVCIFGGTFDPFHDGHLALARAALDVNDRLLIVVAGAAPHKFVDEEDTPSEQTPFHHRVAMTRLGTEALPRTEVLELEGRRRGPSYTVDTVEALVKSHPEGTRFRLLVGADMFRDFTTWKDWERILQMASLLVARRPGHPLEAPAALESWEHRVRGLEAPLLDVSSTAIRAAVAAGDEPGPDVPRLIRAYIRDHGLYGATSP